MEERGGLRRTYDVAACTLLLTVILAAGMMVGRTLLDGSVRFDSIPRGMRLFMQAGGFMVLAAVATFRLESLRFKGASIGCIAATAAFAALLASGSALGNPALVVLGMAAYAVAHVWLMFLFACGLTRLGSIKHAAVASVGGVVLSQLALPLYGLAANFGSELAATSALCLVGALIAPHLARPCLEALAKHEPVALLELTNPDSPMRPNNHLYECVLLVALTYGFANASLTVPGLSVRRIVVVLLMLAVLCWLLIGREDQEDRLFSLIVLFMMAGLLLAPVLLEGDTFLAHTFQFLGSSCLTVLLWLLVWSLGTRNLSAMVPFFGVIFSLDCLGKALGSSSLDIAAKLTGGLETDEIRVATLLLALAFFAFIWLRFRDFSFCSAIRGVEPAANMEPVAALPDTVEDPSADNGPVAADLWESRFGDRCRTLAEQAQLTPRETEIFTLLARGRNARFIMESLSVTRNTAKAHISHVYAKLGVHSHQELLSLVEEG